MGGSKGVGGPGNFFSTNFTEGSSCTNLPREAIGALGNL